MSLSLLPPSRFLNFSLGFTLFVFSVAYALAQQEPSSSTLPVSRMAGVYEFPRDNLEVLTQWNDVLKREQESITAAEGCLNPSGGCFRVEAILYSSMIHSLRPLPPMQKLIKINQFINTLIIAGDAAEHPQTERITATPWQTSFEFLRTPRIPDNAAIVKYFALRASGFSKDDLRISVARDVLRNTRHMVLTALIDGNVYTLDTRSNSVMSQADVTHYIFYYSFNETTRWAYVPVLAETVSPHRVDSPESGQETPQQ